MTTKKCILVTGGAGYIGSHAVVELLKQDFEVVVVDNLCNSNIESIDMCEKITKKKVRFYKVDLLDYEKLDEVFNNFNFFAVIHFAGLKAVGESVEKPLSYYRNNLIGTLNLIKAMEKHECYNIIFSSSATVYGDPKDRLPIVETMETGSCTNPYGKTKHMIEQILMDVCQANKAWNAVLLRYFNPVGAHESGLIGENPLGIPNNLTPFIAQVAIGRREELKVFGNDYDTLDGTGLRDYIHVVDLVLGHVASLKALEQKCGCKVYNLGTGKGYTVLEVVDAFEKVSGTKIKYKIVGRRKGDVSKMYADASLASKDLGWTAQKGILEMCEDLWRWQTMNPNGFQGSSRVDFDKF